MRGLDPGQRTHLWSILRDLVRGFLVWVLALVVMIVGVMADVTWTTSVGLLLLFVGSGLAARGLFRARRGPVRPPGPHGGTSHPGQPGSD